MTKEEKQEAARQYINSGFVPNDYNAFIAGIQYAESENERLKAENGILKAKIIKIRCELLASTNLCNSFEVDRIFSENKAHWNNDLGESLKVTSPKQSCPQCKTEYTKEELLTNEHCFKCGFEMKGF